MPAYDKADLERRMHGAVEALKHDLGGLRTGRASTALLDPVTVEVYGANMPLNQVATVSAPEPRMLSVQVWDRSNVGPVEKAIRSAGLGLNPITDGQNLRLPIPDLTEERRKELAKLAHQYAEKARIAVRNVRRDGMDALKTDEKKKRHQRGRAQAARGRGAEADRRDDRGDRRGRRRQGKGNPAASEPPASAQTCSRQPAAPDGGAVPAPCRHHHGRQRPLGEGAAACRASPATAQGAEAARKVAARRRRGRGRVPDALRLLVRELAAAGARRSAI